MQPRRKERPQSIGEFLKILDGGGANADETTIFPDEPIVVPDEPVRPQPAPRPAPEPTAQPDSSPLKKMLLPIIIVAAALFTFLLWPKGSSAPEEVIEVIESSAPVATSQPTAAPAKVEPVAQTPAPVKEETPAPTKQQATTGTINGHEWVDLGLSVKWATCNVGAESPEEYGDYFAWGEITTKSEYTEENCATLGENKYNIGDISGNPEYDTATANWGGSWRMPTYDEMQELVDNCTWKWATQGGKNGYKVTSKINGNSIFLPAAGYRKGSSLSNVGSSGEYWNSMPAGRFAQGAYNLYFVSDGYYHDWVGRAYGRSVRPVTE